MHVSYRIKISSEFLSITLTRVSCSEFKLDAIDYSVCDGIRLCHFLKFLSNCVKLKSHVLSALPSLYAVYGSNSIHRVPIPINNY